MLKPFVRNFLFSTQLNIHFLVFKTPIHSLSATCVGTKVKFRSVHWWEKKKKRCWLWNLISGPCLNIPWCDIQQMKCTGMQTTLFRAVSFTTFPFTLKQIVFPIIQWYFRPFCVTMLNATWVILWRGLSKPRYYKLLCMKKWIRLRRPYETEREQVREIEHPVEEYDAVSTCNEVTDVRIWASAVRCSHVKSLQNGASM